MNSRRAVFYACATLASSTLACVSSSPGGPAAPDAAGLYGSLDGAAPTGGDASIGAPVTEDGGGSTACTYSVTGSNTASGSCTATGEFGTSTGKLAITLVTANAEFEFYAQLGTAADLQTGTYTSAAGSAVQGTCESVVTASGEVWAATFNESGKADQGTFTLNLTSTGSSFTVDGGTAWINVHGTVTATLPAADTLATGTATATATF